MSIKRKRGVYDGFSFVNLMLMKNIFFLCFLNFITESKRTGMLHKGIQIDSMKEIRSVIFYS